MLKPDIAAQICERLSFATPNEVALNKLSSQVKNNLNLFPPESLLKLCESIAPVGNFSEVYDNYWNQLTSS
jgi:spermidine/putrescine transport system substrate-binding protein